MGSSRRVETRVVYELRNPDSTTGWTHAEVVTTPDGRIAAVDIRQNLSVAPVRISLTAAQAEVLAGIIRDALKGEA